MEITSLNAIITPQTVKAVNVPFYDFNLSITKEGLKEVAVQIVVTPAVKVEITLDGTNYYGLKENVILKEKAFYRYDIVLLEADLFNVRAPAGCTVEICRVQEVPPTYK